MKRIALCLVLLWSACAWGDVMEFRHFSLDVPEGWTASEEGAVVSVVAGDKSASLTITTDSPNGSTIGELAAKFSLELGGTAPERDEDGNYTFEFHGGNSQAMIMGDEDFYMLIIASGMGINSDVLIEILSSLEMK